MIGQVATTIVLMGFAFGLPSSPDTPDKAPVPAETWLYQFDRPDGKKVTNVLKLKRDGERLTGSLKLAGEVSDLHDGKVGGDGTISFTSDFTTDQGEPFQYRCRGRAEGRTMRLRMEMVRGGRTRLISEVEYDRDPAER